MTNDRSAATVPLTARKIAHIRSMVAKTMAGRTQPVTLTLRTPTGGTSTITINAIWRVQADFDPTYQGPTNALTHLGTEADVLCQINMAEVSLPQLKATLWASLAPNQAASGQGSIALGAQPAQKYTLTDIETAGIPEGGDRFICRFTRQH
jgi:hypothetical protein